MSKQEDAPGAALPLSKTRLEAFSDGVFAIATTLLVLDIALHPPGSPLKQVLEAWPYYLAYLVSFLTIGGAWLAHTALTDRLARADAILLRLNLLVLLGVGFLRSPPGSSPKRSTTSMASESSSPCTGLHCSPFASSGSRSTNTRARTLYDSGKGENTSNLVEAISQFWSSMRSRSSSVSPRHRSPSRSTSASPSIWSCPSEKSTPAVPPRVSVPLVWYFRFAAGPRSATKAASPDGR